MQLQANACTKQVLNKEIKPLDLVIETKELQYWFHAHASCRQTPAAVE